MAERYYIAYGSNLSIEQMKYRTPDAEIAGIGELEGWRLLFRQFATIEKCKGYSVPVVIWKISEQDEKNLDRYEGYPKFYEKRDLKIRMKSLTDESTREVTGMVYVMTPQAVKTRSKKPMPTIEYFSLIVKCYALFGFNQQILNDAISEAIR